MVDGVKLYERLCGELNNQLSKESYQVKITNDEMVKINCNKEWCLLSCYAVWLL
jgi:hypothetical protein